MHFNIVSRRSAVQKDKTATGYLIEDDWDDWFEFSTLYEFIYIDFEGNLHEVGSVKFGQFNMLQDQRRPDLPRSFTELNSHFFSLGQDDSYYATLKSLMEGERIQILQRFRDISYDLNIFEQALAERVTRISLLRFVSPMTVRNQYNRLANGGTRLTEFQFTYTLPNQQQNARSPSLEFSVQPNSTPPTNIHTLIGRNGVGKTFILERMARCLTEEGSRNSDNGAFTHPFDTDLFSGVVSVTFSAFDPFEPLSVSKDRADSIQYRYIGLKKVNDRKQSPPGEPKTPSALTREFGDSVKACILGGKGRRWADNISKLETDPIFQEAEISSLTSFADDPEELRKQAGKKFRNLSSGHKIVALTITRLVEYLQEKTLVLLDEPEAHLHPPLLSTFVRTLSDLLVDRNGVAIIATHSPVVLQEVPRSCVWKISRMGYKALPNRPFIETFGENVGVLTHEVFGLEVTDSGFYALLHQWAVEKGDYEEVLEIFDGELGGEAKAILRSLISVVRCRQ